MAEIEDVPESEAAATAGGVSQDPALGLAVASRRGKAKGDPQLDAFLVEQTRLARLQSEHLHEQRELVLSRLRWGRFSDRMKAILQLLTAMVGAAVVALIAAMAWQAHGAHGLEIDAFSVPPDLARTGLTGQVVASRFLDRLQAMQTATENSDRPAQSYESNWGTDFKVEIPDTGLTFSDFERLLRDKLGHVSHVTGEVMTTPEGIAITARMGDSPPQTFTGAPAAIDDLERKAAESIYRTSQPYRYAEYLDGQGRSGEAFAVVADLAANGPSSERGWAYAKWAEMDLNNHGDLASARMHASRGLGFGAGSDLSDRISLVNVEVWSGHDEPVLSLSKILDRDDQKRLPDTSRTFFEVNKLLGRAWLQFITPDFPASARTWIVIGKDLSQPRYGAFAPAMAASAYALGHDLPAAADQRTGPPAADASLASRIADGAFLAFPSYWMAAERGQWTAALAAARTMDAALDAGRPNRPIYGLMQRVWVWPLEAQALARTGQAVAAQALIERTPVDCYLCLRVRGLVAAERRDGAGADRWFAEAVRQAPSLPFAYAEWGRARLDRGDADGAIAELQIAHAKAPRFADPLETWGEAVAAKGDFAGAVRRYSEADRLAPRWGRNHLDWGLALARLGRRDAARAQFKAAAALALAPTDQRVLAAHRG